MKIAMLSPIAWRTPPNHYGPWESVVSLLTEGLVARGIDVTLFATGDSRTRARLQSVCPQGYEENNRMLPKVWECLHISEVFENGNAFDLIHNHFDYLPLTYSRMTSTPVLTTIHGFSSPEILPVYKKYNGKCFYIAISEADKSPELDYTATIHHGIDFEKFFFRSDHGKYLLFFGRIHPDKGTAECIEVARRTGMDLVIAGIIQDKGYFDKKVKPHLDNSRIIYVGSVGPKKRNILLGGAYALLHPIRFDEPFGLSVAEAMACGTPVVAFSRGSMPELVVHGETGFLTTDIDEMIRTLKNVKDIDRRKCRQRIKSHFSVDRMVSDYIRVYKSIVEQTQREDHRPWGFYEVLTDQPGLKVKRITVYPGQRLSYQRHFRRSEHWYIISGTATVTKNGKKIERVSGQAFDLPVETWHRVENSGSENLVFIEVQTGDYLGEDDIERSEDDYGRIRQFDHSAL
ncbi:mannose-6-phosphate isomerase [Desulfobacter hydrogenophilus]|uniref:Glycosyltransferase n=1 Tax=Desulfobacter hydrogenophilus TaxID=2291 RepID=A0A328FDL0_9BACT|nr:glycosyltransferase [Desulfobacter hydrogenophilus]NDY72877.1 glycosyltransferase [Desulfobacter hydrogenophilus]QBH13591.1 glycosyltransferase [Desulfobacter hydrogenophilus]RAM01183.1 mannose-6-phosphate isomerase [Desulfobacter hydrogenophilus]